jgi:hypothetical protein
MERISDQSRLTLGRSYDGVCPTIEELMAPNRSIPFTCIFILTAPVGSIPASSK